MAKNCNRKNHCLRALKPRAKLIEMLSQTTRKPSLSRGDFVEFRLVMQRLLKLEYFHTLNTNKKKETKILGKWQVPLEMSNEARCTEVDFLLYRPLVRVELLNFE